MYIVTGVPDKIENLYYKVLLCPDVLRHAKTPKCECNQNTRYTNKITTLHIIYHQKGLIEEILDHQTKLYKTLSRQITIDMLLTWVSPALSKIGVAYIPVV